MACLSGRIVYFLAKTAAIAATSGREEKSIPSSIRPLLSSVFPTVNISAVRYVDDTSIPANWFDSDDTTGGMTFGNMIYLRDKFDEGDSTKLKLLLHELTHTSQVVRFGNESRFACKYGEEYAAAGFSYEDNKLEVEASEKADAVIP